MNIFKKAVKEKLLLRLALDGPSGSGKTFSSLRIATGLGTGKIAGIDTENSMRLYADRFEFDVSELEKPYNPEKYIEAIKNAEESGYKVLIIDSLTHAWAGQGGILDIHDKATKSVKNSFVAWRHVTPQHNALVEAMLSCKCHLIITIRTKTAYEIIEENGKKKPVKVGLAPIQKEGLEYEFTTCFNLSVEGNVASTSKDRTSLFVDKYFTPTEETGKQFIDWLNSGVAIAKDPKPKPVSTAKKSSVKERIKEERATPAGQIKDMKVLMLTVGMGEDDWTNSIIVSGIDRKDESTFTEENIDALRNELGAWCICNDRTNPL